MISLLAGRPRVAVALAIAAILATSTAIHVRSRHPATPHLPITETEALRWPPPRPCESRMTGIEPGTMRIAGVVVDDRKRPVGHAAVSLNGVRRLTGPDGSFAFDGLASGNYELIAVKDLLHGEHWISLDWLTGPTELAMHLGPTLVVRVVDPAGAPVAGATVTKPGNLDGCTDRDGTVRFHSEPGRGYAHVVAPGRASAWLNVDLGEDPLAPTGAVSGSVIAAAPEQHDQVQVLSHADGRLYRTKAVDGAFWFTQLPVGDYTASVAGRAAVPFHVTAGQMTAIALP